MKWSKISVGELLEAIGQDTVNIRDNLVGTSYGDHGRVSFFTLCDDLELRLVFEAHEDALAAFNAMSRELSNPYEFSSRFDVMPEVVIIQFTE